MLALGLSACAPAVMPGYEGTDFSSLTMEEKGEYVYECLRSKGWDVTLNEGGSIFSEGDSSQTGRFAADTRECDAPIVAAAIPASEWSSESWDELYTAVVSEGDCLKALGLRVPQPPSREKFIEDTLADNQWAPRMFIYGQTPPPGVDLEVECPQVDFIPRRG